MTRNDLRRVYEEVGVVLGMRPRCFDVRMMIFRLRAMTTLVHVSIRWLNYAAKLSLDEMVDLEP